MSENHQSRYKLRHYGQLSTDSITILAAIVFLYAYIRKSGLMAKLVFYWLLTCTILHIAWYFVDLKAAHVTTLESRLRQIFLASFYAYLAGIVTTFIQILSAVKKLSAEHLGILEEWDDFELDDLVGMNTVQQQPEEESDDGGDAISNKQRKTEKNFNWNDNLDFTSHSWNIQEILAATQYHQSYMAKHNHQ